MRSNLNNFVSLWKKTSLVLLLACLLCQFSCKKDNPEIPDEGELITTLKYTLETPGEVDPVIMTFRDLDGPGGNDPDITAGTLKSSTVYFGNLELLNEAESPAENITAEIEAEKADHQFFFLINGLDMTVTYADTDENNNPVGLFTAITTGQPGNGNLIINLQHEPNKLGAGVSEGNLNNAGGETDIQVNFPVTIQ